MNDEGEEKSATEEEDFQLNGDWLINCRPIAKTIPGGLYYFPDDWLEKEGKE